MLGGKELARVFTTTCQWDMRAWAYCCYEDGIDSTLWPGFEKLSPKSDCGYRAWYALTMRYEGYTREMQASGHRWRVLKLTQSLIHKKDHDTLHDHLRLQTRKGIKRCLGKSLSSFQWGPPVSTKRHFRLHRQGKGHPHCKPKISPCQAPPNPKRALGVELMGGLEILALMSSNDRRKGFWTSCKLYKVKLKLWDDYFLK